MAYLKDVTHVDCVAGVHTLTLSDVDDLYVGDSVRVSGTTNDYDGNHTIDSINTTNKTITFTQAHADHDPADVQGQLIVLVKWTDDDLVEEWLGIDAATVNDTAYIAECVEAGNEWAFTKRLQAGYSDRAALVPSPAVKQGTTLYAAMLYRERGAVDSFASFDSMAVAGGPSMSLGRIMQLLGVNRSQVA